MLTGCRPCEAIRAEWKAFHGRHWTTRRTKQKRLSSPSFIRDAVEAASLRYMLAHLDKLSNEDRAKHERDWDRASSAEADKLERQAFDTFEAGEREKRFQQWRTRFHAQGGD